MKLRVVSDGTAKGTGFFNADNGERLDIPVIGILWELNAARGFAVAKIDVMLSEVELTVESERLIMTAKQIGVDPKSVMILE